MPPPSSCPFCASTTAKSAWETDTEKGLKMEYALCDRCHTAYPSPAPSAETLAAAYTADYYGSGESKFGGPIERFRKACARVTARRLCAHLPPTATILDIAALLLRHNPTIGIILRKTA